MSSASGHETAPEIDAPIPTTPVARKFIYGYETTPEIAAQWENLHNRVLTEEETDLVAYVKVLHAVGLQKNKYDCDQIKLFKAGDLLHRKITNPVEFDSDHSSKFARFIPLPAPEVLKAELADINREIAVNERRRHRLVRIVKNVLLCIEAHEGKSRARATKAIRVKLGKEVPQWQYKAAAEMYESWVEQKEEEINAVALSMSVLTEAEHQEEHKKRWDAANTLPAEDRLPGIMQELERVITPLSAKDINGREWYEKIEI